MPWEKSFNIDDAVNNATNVFWAKGYEAASLADLLKAMNINKGSFYNAFGSKKELFILSLLKYDREQPRAMLSRLSTLKNPVLAITGIFDELIAQSLSDDERKGCYMVNLALDLPNLDEDTVRIVTKGLVDFEAFFKQEITLGHKDGSIPQTVDADVTSKALMALVVGLRVLSRGVYDNIGLQAIKIQALDLIK